MRKLFTLLSFICIASLSGFAQFEGVLSYDITYKSENPEKVEYFDAFPTASILKVKNELTRFDQQIAGGGNQSFILNSKTEDCSLLMNFMGQKFQVNLGADEISQLEQVEKLTIVKTDKTKEIAGYQCQHAYAISGEDSLSIYYTTDIQVGNVLPQFADLDGLPLYYEMNRGDVHMTYVCTQIQVEEVPAKTFEIEAGVREIPFETFAQSFAKMK